MAVTRSSSGSITASASTTLTLATETTAGVFQLQFTVASVSSSDFFHVWYYTKPLSGETEQIAWTGAFGYAYLAGTKSATCPAIPVVDHLKVTIQQPDGVFGKVINWAIYKIA